jgi:hypothetical protein
MLSFIAVPLWLIALSLENIEKRLKKMDEDRDDRGGVEQEGGRRPS